MIKFAQHAPLLAACVPFIAYLARNAGVQIDVGRVRLNIRRRR